MAFKELNIVIGGITKGFDKSIKKVEKNLNRFSRKAQDIGGTLTESLTLPIAGIGTLRRS